MRRIKNNLPLFLFVALLYIIFNVITFMLAKDYGVRFWFGYIYVMIAWICLAGVSFLSTEDKRNRYILNAPIIVVSVIHFLIQAMIAIATSLFESFSLKVSIVLFLVVISVYIVLVSGLFVYKRRVNKSR